MNKLCAFVNCHLSNLYIFENFVLIGLAHVAVVEH